MRTVEEVRRLRLLDLKRQYGSWAALNVAVGKGRLDSTFSQIVNESTGSKSGAPKQMGSPLARAIEDALKKGRGWMDTDPGLATSAHAPDNPPALQPSLPSALPVVLDALAASPHRAELRSLLALLVDTDAPAYRARLAELLADGARAGLGFAIG